MKTLFTVCRESLHGSESVDAHVKAVLVVVSQEIGQSPRSGDGRGIRAGVGPFSQTAADEAFRLAVGLRPIGPGPIVPEFQPATQRAKPVAPIGAAVVGQEPPHHDATSRKPAMGQSQKGRGTGRRFVWEEGGIGQARPIVDGDVQEFCATPAAASAVIAVNAVPRSAEAAQLLDVPVDQLARDGALVPAHRRSRGTRATGQPEATLHVHDGRERQPKIPRDPERAPAPLPPPGDLAALDAGKGARCWC